MQRAGWWIAAMLLGSAAAQAGNAVCTVAVSGVAFGSFNPLSGQSAATNGTIAITCSGAASDTASYTIAITSGMGSFSARKLVAGADTLTYNLYKDSGCTQVWGDGTAGTSTVSDSVTLTATSVTTHYVVYGRIAAAQRGSKVNGYTDNLLVTITY